MMADDDLDLGEEKKSSKLPLLLGGAAGVILVVLATLYFTGFFSSADKDEASSEQASAAAAAETPRDAHYLSLDPPFVVNFPGHSDARLLQVSVSVLAYDEDTVAVLEKHSPMIRNNILLLLSGQDPAALRQAEGKDALRASILETLQKVAEAQGGKSAVEQVFFTAFVMQ